MRYLVALLRLASRAFGCLKRPIFQNANPSLATKRAVYRAAVLSVLLYGAEAWTTKAEHVKRLNVFHNRCVRSILGVTKYQQWKEHISTRQLAATFEMEETMADLLMKHRLRWLGHLGHMEPNRLPKQMLFGELQKKRPCHGTKKRWRDAVTSDLQAIGIKDSWYEIAQDRKKWHQVCTDGIRAVAEQKRHTRSVCAASLARGSGDYPCPCGRSFRWKGDRTRHSRFCGGAPR